MFRHKKHLFFDLDHTLWDFELNASECLAELFETFNMATWGITFPQFFQAFSSVNQSLWFQLEQQQITHEHLRTIRFKASLATLDVTISEEQSEQINDRFLELLPYKKGLMANCLEVLENLRGKYQMHILSNGFQEVQMKKMHHSGLTPFFDKIITNELAGARKPDRRIFDFALQNTQSEITEVLMIGDSFEADIKGALNAGWDAIHFHESKADLRHDRYFHVADLHQILTYL